MPTKKNINNFYAILEDNSVRKIILTQEITSIIRDVFISGASSLLNAGTEEIKFDGKYHPQEDEILYVAMDLPSSLQEISSNSIGIPNLNLKKDSIKALVWFENNEYYFQVFDKRKLLDNKNVLFFDKDTYSKLKQNAFVVDNIVNAIFKSKKFYFHNYTIANRIFSLIEYYHEATDTEVKTFSTNKKIEVDSEWLLENSNSVIRKHISFLQQSGILRTANTKKIKTSAKKFELVIELNDDGKIIFPQDKKVCREILSFLNEQYYIGVITGNKYKANSKRDA